MLRQVEVLQVGFQLSQYGFLKLYRLHMLDSLMSKTCFQDPIRLEVAWEEMIMNSKVVDLEELTLVCLS